MKLDLKSSQGKEIFLKLVKHYDVVLESFRPGVMDRLGLGYEVLRRKNASLVYCAISGYGQDGPYRDLVGHDINYIALGGILGSTGSEEGKPAIPSVQIADIGVGSLMSAMGILSALIRQKTTGKGAFVDISMLDGIAFWMHLPFAEYFVTGKLPQSGREMLTGKFPCYNVYETKDRKYVAIGALEAKFWASFCNAINKPELIEHQYATGERRRGVIDQINKIFKAKDKDEWVALFKEIDICFAPVNSLDEVTKDKQLEFRKMFFEIEHPKEGKVKQINSPIKYKYLEEREKENFRAPNYGEHTVEILRNLGYSDEQIKQLDEYDII